VCIRAVCEGASRTDVSVTLSRDPWPNELSYTFLTRSGPQHKMENSWTACKSKSSFLSCEAELSAIISFETCVFALTCKCRNMLISSNFSKTTQFSKTFFKALAQTPRPTFVWCVGRAFRHVIAKKPARLNNGHISNSRFVIHRFQKKTGSCTQARLNSPRAFKMADEMLGKNEKIRMYVG